MSDNFHQEEIKFSFGQTTDSAFRLWINEKWF